MTSRLTDAAPDLLEALKGMLEVFGVREEHMERGRFDRYISRTEVETCNEARAAVFKATGELQ